MTVIKVLGIVLLVRVMIVGVSSIAAFVALMIFVSGGRNIEVDINITKDEKQDSDQVL